MLDKYKKKFEDCKKKLEEYRKQFKKYLEQYKIEVKKCIDDLKHKDTFYKQIPNLLTISRPIGMIPVNILLFTGNIVPAIILTGCLFITDFFDGKIARKYNIVSKFGADLDAVCDKVMFLGLVLPLLISNPILIISLLFEAGIAFVNVLGRMKGFDTKTVYSGKVKTWLLSLTLGVGYLGYLFGISSSLLNLFVGLTTISQGVAMVEYIKRYNELKKEKEEENIVFENEVVLEKIDDKKQDRLLEVLKKEREFVLSIQEPGKVYTGKKRVRMKIEEKMTR